MLFLLENNDFLRQKRKSTPELYRRRKPQGSRRERHFYHPTFICSQEKWKRLFWFQLMVYTEPPDWKLISLPWRRGAKVLARRVVYCLRTALINEKQVGGKEQRKYTTPGSSSLIKTAIESLFRRTTLSVTSCSGWFRLSIFNNNIAVTFSFIQRFNNAVDCLCIRTVS